MILPAHCINELQPLDVAYLLLYRIIMKQHYMITSTKQEPKNLRKCGFVNVMFHLAKGTPRRKCKILMTIMQSTPASRLPSTAPDFNFINPTLLSSLVPDSSHGYILKAANTKVRISNSNFKVSDTHAALTSSSCRTLLRNQETFYIHFHLMCLF